MVSCRDRNSQKPYPDLSQLWKKKLAATIGLLKTVVIGCSCSQMFFVGIGDAAAQVSVMTIQVASVDTPTWEGRQEYHTVDRCIRDDGL